MNAALLARLASLLLVLTLMLPAFEAVASGRGQFGRRGRAGIHRPVYRPYKPSTRWIFEKR